MAETIFRGPDVSAGSLMDNRVEPFDGPGIVYQADCFPDVRFGPLLKDGLSVARVKSFLNSPYAVMTDALLQASTNTAIIAASQTATLGTAMVLNATALGPGGMTGTLSYCPGLPIVPFGQSTVTTVAAIDFGFATGTTVANSSAVVVQDSTQFQAGQWIMIGGTGAGNTSGTFTQVQNLLNATTIQVSPSPVAALTNAPIGSVNLYGSGLLPPATQFGPSAPVPTAVQPYIAAGLAAMFNPLEGVSRSVRVLSVTTVLGTAQFLVTGYDIYGQRMTELMSAVLATAAGGGKKAFKYIQSIVPQQTQAGPFTVSLSDNVGFNIRSDKWEYSNIFFAGAFATNNAGWTAAFTGPANSTSGDVRGTVQLSTAGPLGTAAAAGANVNGTTRLTLMMSVPLYNLINATPINPVPIFGPTQA